MTHYPPHIKPLPYTTVLLIHYCDSPDDENPIAPVCETGVVDEEGNWLWHNPHAVDEDEVPLVVHAWMPLPLIPERP